MNINCRNNHRHNTKEHAYIKNFICMSLIIGAIFIYLVGGQYKMVMASGIENNAATVSTVADEISENLNKKVDNFELPWNLILINPWNSLPENFKVERTQLKNGHSIDKRAYPELQEMMDDARKQGLSPLICSSYRTNEKQTTLFQNQIKKQLAKGLSNERAIEEAKKWVAEPGTSEHQVGLAVDIVAISYQILDEKQADTKEQKWLMENSYKYGFILRYPKDKVNVTGIAYEPWHYRYVGKEAAKEIYEKGICLEEYIESLKK